MHYAFDSDILMQDRSAKIEGLGKKMEMAGIEVNFGSRIHGFTPHPCWVFLGFVSKPLAQAANKSFERKTHGKLWRKFSLIINSYIYRKIK